MNYKTTQRENTRFCWFCTAEYSWFCYANSMKKPARFVALLRGINVGGNKKVPMADLKKMLEKMEFTNVKTLLASGNVLFDSTETDMKTLRAHIETQLEKTFGFPVPTLIRTLDDLRTLKESEPFNNIRVFPETRLYITFLSEKSTSTLKTPYVSPDGNYKILRVSDTEVCSVLTVTKDHGTIDAMSILEKEFGRQITTRNWNTIEKMLVSS